MRFAPVFLAVILGLLPAASAAQDTVPEPNPRRAEQLRQMIDQRFGERIKEDLGLSDDQFGRLRVALATVATRRRILQEEEMRLRSALAFQLRPGIAASPDSVAKLVDALTNQRVAFAQTFRDEMRELSTILNPVQRGQYLILRDRLMARAEQLRQAMPMGPQPRLPPARPRLNPRRPQF